ncbi:MAG: porin family protein [Gemmatimonadales bacterium]|jgi:hypothetical protein|nr:porin family protein [Gemmatimonadales bacterium]
MRTALVTSLLLSLLATSPALAQGKLRHDDFWFGAGLGVGWGDYGNDRSDTRTGVAGHVRAGGTIFPNLLVGGESNGYWGSDEGANYYWGSLMATASWYPARDLPFFLKGGAGYLYTFASEGGADLGSSGHFAFQAGLGWDIQLGDNTAATLVANWIQTLQGNLEVDGRFLGQVTPQLIQLGVGFSLY